MKHSPEGLVATEIIIETFKLGGLLVTEGDRISASLGLTSSRWKILGALARSGSSLTVSQIARNMGQTRQAVQSLVNILEAADLLELADNPNHKRSKLAVLTKKGEDIYKQMEAIQIPWVNQLVDEIKVEDLQVTIETLRKISNSLCK